MPEVEQVALQWQKKRDCHQRMCRAQLARFTHVNNFSPDVLVGISSPSEVIESRLVLGVLGGNTVERRDTEQMEEAGNAQVEINWKEEGMRKGGWRARGCEERETC